MYTLLTHPDTPFYHWNFSNSSILQKEVIQFLRSKMTRQPIASDCHQRLMKTVKNGQRKYPPHLVEVDAIQVSHTAIVVSFGTSP